MKLEIVTPEKMVFSKNIGMAILPGAEGDFGVLDNHSPVISELREGEVAVFANATDSVANEKFAIKGGIAQVTATTCTILATAIQQAA